MTPKEFKDWVANATDGESTVYFSGSAPTLWGKSRPKPMAAAWEAYTDGLVTLTQRRTGEVMVGLSAVAVHDYIATRLRAIPGVP